MGKGFGKYRDEIGQQKRLEQGYSSEIPKIQQEIEKSQAELSAINVNVSRVYSQTSSVNTECNQIKQQISSQLVKKNNTAARAVQLNKELVEETLKLESLQEFLEQQELELAFLDHLYQRIMAIENQSEKQTEGGANLAGEMSEKESAFLAGDELS